MSVSREEFDALKDSVESLKRRLADLITPLTMSLPRVERNVARVLEILEPRKVIVDADS